MIRALASLVFFLIALSSCSSAGGANLVNETGNRGDSSKLKVVTSFTIIEDIVKQIGGPQVDVHNLVPAGSDPHEYELLPDDLRAIASADLIFYNGFNLEGGDDGWLGRAISSLESTDITGTDNEHKVSVVKTSQQITPLYLEGEKGEVSQINPHVFADPNNGIMMVEEIAKALEAALPENAEEIENRTSEYVARLTEIEARYAAEISAIPKQNRVLVTSERAFQYLALRYEIGEAYLWAIDTEESGSVTQLKNLIDFLRETPVKHLVLESNVDPRPMETVSAETKIPIYEKRILSDELGVSDLGSSVSTVSGDTYQGYLEHNLAVITGALK